MEIDPAFSNLTFDLFAEITFIHHLGDVVDIIHTNMPEKCHL